MVATRWFEDVVRMRVDPLGVVLDGARRGKDLVHLRYGPWPVWMVYAPEHVRKVLVEHPEQLGRQTRGQKLLRRTLGLSMLTAEDEEWRWRRRVAQPSFKRDVLKGFDGVIVQAAERLADEMLASEGPVDLSVAMSDLALHVACSVLFADDLGPDAALVHDGLNRVLAGYLRLSMHPIATADQWPLPRSIRFRAARRQLSDVMGRVVERRRARPPGDDLLSTWLAAHRPDGAPMNATELDAEGVTMLLAGHETTANAMAFAFGLLARSPQVARRVLAELDEVLGDRPVTHADLDRLPFLSAVFEETLRLYPPAWIVSRSTRVPMTLGRHELPAGAFVFVPIHAVHRLPAHWDDPEGFDPDRWLDGRGERARKAGAYLPFGAGQRRCIGEHLGRMEARLVMATVLRRVRLELLPGEMLAPEVSVTLRPRGGLSVRASARA
ncbi:MAG: cytochrome P450 [Myxococcales bacterium]|nr:cytochrome P450 [Myxococcales bacterium]